MSQYGIKKDKYDITFAKFIKLRDKCCQKCGNQSRQLECSHIFSRSNQGTRCDPANACLKCNICHRWWHSNPVAAAEWLKAIIGEDRYDRLRYKANTPTKMKPWVKDEIRLEQIQLIKQMESGELVLEPFNKMYK